MATQSMGHTYNPAARAPRQKGDGSAELIGVSLVTGLLTLALFFI